MNKRLLALITALILLFLLAACGNTEQAGPLPPDGQVQPSEPDTQEPEPEPEPPEKDVIEVSPGLYMLDCGYLERQGMTVDHVFPASRETLMVFTSHLSENGTVSEYKHLYTFSMSQMAFTGKSMPVGLVAQYPSVLLDDGSAAVITLDSESYEYKELLYIDPSNLSYVSVAIPAIPNLRSIEVAPDKTKVALNTLDGLLVTEADFTTQICAFPNYAAPEGAEGESDEEENTVFVPYATQWSDDSRLLAGKIISWEWLYHPFVIDTDSGETKELHDLPASDIIVLDKSHLFCFDFFTMIPQGIYDIGQQLLSELPFDTSSYLAEDENGEAEEYIYCLAVSSDNLVLCSSSPNGGGEKAGKAALFNLTAGEEAQFFIGGEGDAAISFEAAAFVPQSSKVVLMTHSTVHQSKQIYIATY